MVPDAKNASSLSDIEMVPLNLFSVEIRKLIDQIIRGGSVLIRPLLNQDNPVELAEHLKEVRERYQRIEVSEKVIKWEGRRVIEDVMLTVCVPYAPRGVSGVCEDAPRIFHDGSGFHSSFSGMGILDRRWPGGNNDHWEVSSFKDVRVIRHCPSSTSNTPIHESIKREQIRDAGVPLESKRSPGCCWVVTPSVMKGSWYRKKLRARKNPPAPPSGSQSHWWLRQQYIMIAVVWSMKGYQENLRTRWDTRGRVGQTTGTVSAPDQKWVDRSGPWHVEKTAKEAVIC
ncbi:hypothetical protein BU15DRAFT_67943 [Melanogaster broomeanus]|nr:hypothetical protein BU15DRAFT_67943 [Melanogaster broomeanus]